MGFLSEIVAATRASVRSPSYLAELSPTPPPPRASLREAVRRDAPRGALLVEYKRVSPGQADPRLPARSVDDFVRATAPAPVTGYSCLATGPRFEGAPRDVADLARATAVPVLFKDFVVEPVQLDAAVRAGASAVLLIARLETEGHLTVPLEALAAGAQTRGLEVLLEFHRRSELSVADRVPADMYGVNVRDLDSLAFDRSAAEGTLVAAREAGLSPLLGLSGVDDSRAAGRFWSAGADGLLVGTAVARSHDPVGFLRSLTREHAPSGEGPA